MKHIGMDVHSTTTDACIRNGKGLIVLQRRIKTTQTELLDFINGGRTCRPLEGLADAEEEGAAGFARPAVQLETVIETDRDIPDFDAQPEAR